MICTYYMEVPEQDKFMGKMLDDLKPIEYTQLSHMLIGI